MEVKENEYDIWKRKHAFRDIRYRDERPIEMMAKQSSISSI